MQNHLQQNASPCPVIEPSVHDGAAEQPEQPGRNPFRREFRPEQWRVPDGPGYPQQHTRLERRAPLLKPREQEAAPPGLFTQTDEQENEDEAIGNFSRRGNLRWIWPGRAQEPYDSRRKRGNRYWQQQRHSVPA